MNTLLLIVFALALVPAVFGVVGLIMLGVEWYKATKTLKHLVDRNNYVQNFMPRKSIKESYDEFVMMNIERTHRPTTNPKTWN